MLWKETQERVVGKSDSGGGSDICRASPISICCRMHVGMLYENNSSRIKWGFDISWGPGRLTMRSLLVKGRLFNELRIRGQLWPSGLRVFGATLYCNWLHWSTLPFKESNCNSKLVFQNHEVFLKMCVWDEKHYINIICYHFISKWAWKVSISSELNHDHGFFLLSGNNVLARI